MSRKTNLVNNIILLAATAACIFVVAIIGNGRYSASFAELALLFAAGAVISGVVNVFLHEVGHMLAGKANGFEFVSMRFWFFEFRKNGRKTEFKFSAFTEQAGMTEMIPETDENLEKRFKKVTAGGLIPSMILIAFGIVPLFLNLPLAVYCLWAIFLPVSAYFLLANALPMTSEGVRNDGAVISGINHNDDVSKVTINLLRIHHELYRGKTPSEIDKSLYFDLPQLPEDDLNYIILLNNRYAYYLDGDDYENALKTSERLKSLLDYMPKSFRNAVTADMLYDACVIERNSQKADDITEDLEKFLNNDNNLTNLRIKLAYVLYVLNDKATALRFFRKAQKDAENHRIKGLGRFEKKLLEKMLPDIEDGNERETTDVQSVTE